MKDAQKVNFLKKQVKRLADIDDRRSRERVIEYILNVVERDTCGFCYKTCGTHVCYARNKLIEENK